MSPGTFRKSYSSHRELERAIANHTWLTEHAKPLRLPPLVAVHPDHIELGHVGGRHCSVDDAPAVATALGQAHAAAWQSDLHNALLTHPHPTPGNHELPAFVTPRIAALHKHRDAGLIGESQILAVQPLLKPHPAELTAFYKDTNPRNVMITGDEPVMVDLDDLTLAPFGYDLAKLLVTLAMTHGSLPRGAYATALTCYNRPLLDAGLPLVPLRRLLDYAELHHLLTLPYLGTGGYRHPWPTVRPTSEDLQ
ncbi:phosphotransferase [Nonomuraea sp. NPDC048881]|uniref:phosphotransferase n=1 Tax=Nonomuraea sp. NPDC048881 TaxID=3155030 RepID=UPI0033D2B530